MGCFCSRDSVVIADQLYYVKSRIGEGGFSYVDLVVHSTSHKQFALKRILCHSKEDQNKALQEVKYMKMFNHPNIIAHSGSEVIPVQGGSTSVISKVLILMPLYTGGTLQDIIDSGEYLSTEILLRVLTDVCQALQVMHTMNPPLAHRDIKPANVLIANDYSAVLMDLGSMDRAVITVSNTHEAQILQDDAGERCTMPYRAPELFNVQTGDSVTAATDIWSLGCLMYACVYLQSPFDEIYQKGGSIALAAVGGNIKYPTHKSFYSDSFINLIKSMLVVDRLSRPSIDTIINRLEQMTITAENRV